MKITHKNEEEEIPMMNSLYGGEGAVTVVEYMLSSMSEELLGKFPDNSAYDFDYTQSSIWSPLLPHPLSSSPFSSSSIVDPPLQRKLFSEEDGGCDDDGLLWHNNRHGATAGLKKLTESIKHKISTSGFCGLQIPGKICKKNSKKKAKMGKVLDCFSRPITSSSVKSGPPSSSSTPIKKGWDKVLKVASKHFKKTMKRKDSATRLKLSSGLKYKGSSLF